MKEINFNQSELAKKIGVHRIYLNAVLRGRSRPSPDLALKIENATNGAITRMELLYPSKN